MKTFSMTLLTAAFLLQPLTKAWGQSQTLKLSGTVPVRGDVTVQDEGQGKISVQQNTPDRLHIQLPDRQPSSVGNRETHVKVSAP